MPSETPAMPQHLDDLMIRLRENFATFSSQFQNGARYLLDHPEEVPILSMRKIADNAGVLPATLVRLAQSLGFEGWQDMRQLFVEALHHTSQAYTHQAKKVIRKNKLNDMLQEMLDAQHRNIELISSQNTEALPQAVEQLSTAQNVYVAGFRSCYPIAFGFHYVYRLFRSTVHLIRGDAGTLEMELRTLTSKDVVMLISFAPYSQEIIQVENAARQAGCRIIALTDSTVAPIALNAGCTLLFSIDSPSFFPSITAGMALTEALLEQLLAKKGKGAIKALEQAEGQLHQTGAYIQARRR